jgi:hypothetical protein
VCSCSKQLPWAATFLNTCLPSFGLLAQILEEKADLFFHLQQQRLIELVRAGRVEDALGFAQEFLAPCGEEHPAFLEELGAQAGPGRGAGFRAFWAQGCQAALAESCLAQWGWGLGVGKQFGQMGLAHGDVQHCALMVHLLLMLARSLPEQRRLNPEQGLARGPPNLVCIICQQTAQWPWWHLMI